MIIVLWLYKMLTLLEAREKEKATHSSIGMTWQPTPVFLPGEPHGKRSLVGYRPWGCRVRHDWLNTGKRKVGITFYNFSKSETISERKRERGKKRRKEGKEEESQYENSILNVKKKHTCFQLIFIYELKNIILVIPVFL